MCGSWVTCQEHTWVLLPGRLWLGALGAGEGDEPADTAGHPRRDTSCRCRLRLHQPEPHTGLSSMAERSWLAEWIVACRDAVHMSHALHICQEMHHLECSLQIAMHLQLCSKNQTVYVIAPSACHQTGGKQQRHITAGAGQIDAL